MSAAVMKSGGLRAPRHRTTFGEDAPWAGKGEGEIKGG